MPSNLLQADVGFPQLNEQQSQDEKITQIVNYLYMLLEQLRYNFGNLGIENFNDSGIEELQHVLTEPVFVRLANDEGLINELSVDYTGLYSRLYDETTGDITQLGLTTDGLVLSMYGPDGQSGISATTAGLVTEVWGANPGETSRITQNANAITLKVSQGDVDTSISTFASGLALSVTNGANSSNISITSGGVVLNTQTIQITGMVRFDSFNPNAYSSSTTYNVGDQVTYGGYIYTCTVNGTYNKTPSLTSSYWTRSASTTFINGGLIQTGTVAADCVTTGTITSTTGNINLNGFLTVKNGSTTAGTLGYVSTGQGNSGIGLVAGNYGGWVLAMSNGVKIGYYDGTQVTAVANQLYFKLGTGKDMYLYGSALYPGTTGSLDLGSSTSKWGTVYCNTIYATTNMYINNKRVLTTDDL